MKLTANQALALIDSKIPSYFLAQNFSIGKIETLIDIDNLAHNIISGSSFGWDNKQPIFSTEKELAEYILENFKETFTEAKRMIELEAYINETYPELRL